MDKIKSVVDYMIREGCRCTTSGSWSFDFEELEQRFDLIIDDEMAQQIENELTERPEITDDGVWVDEGTFDLNFWLKYCKRRG